MFASFSTSERPSTVKQRSSLRGDGIPQFISVPSFQHLVDIPTAEVVKTRTKAEASCKSNYCWAEAPLVKPSCTARWLGSGSMMNTSTTTAPSGHNASPPSIDKSPKGPRRSGRECSSPPCVPKRRGSNASFVLDEDSMMIATSIPDLAPRRPERRGSISCQHGKRFQRQKKICQAKAA